MLELLFTSSYLLDIIILILLIIVIFGFSHLLKTLGKQYNFLQKLKLTPRLLVKNTANSFEKLGKKNKSGTHTTSYIEFKKINKLIKRLLQSTFLFVLIKLIVIIITLNIPRAGEAQTEVIHYQDNDFVSFSQGIYNLSQWDRDGITLKAGQYFANYLSQPIGAGTTINQWQNLSWQTDLNYLQKPANSALIIGQWSLDSLETCNNQTTNDYSCQSQAIKLVQGLYGSSAYFFNDQASTVKIAQNITFNGSFTIGAWIKPEFHILNGNEGQDYVILAKGYGDYLSDNAYGVKYSYFFGFKNGALQLSYWPDDNKNHFVTAKDTNYDFSPNRWYHVTGVYDEQNKNLKLYIDGFEQTDIVTDYDGGDIDHKPNMQKDYPTWIGSVSYLWLDGEEKPTNIFEGIIDEVFLTNEVIDLFELRNLINQAGEIYFQVRTGNSLPLTGIFVGPENKTSTFFTSSENNDLSFLPKTKYLQYIAFLARPNTNYRPKIYNVSVDYLPNEVLIKGDESELQITLEIEESIDRLNISTDFEKEKEAIDLFIKFFQALPISNIDWEFINVVAYNQTQQRDLNKEEVALKTFINYMKQLPITDIDWGIVKALAYTLKGEFLLETWQNLK